VSAIAALSVGIAVWSSAQGRREARRIRQRRAQEIDLRMDVLAKGNLVGWARLSQERRDILKGEYEANRSLFQKFVALFRD